MDLTPIRTRLARHSGPVTDWHLAAWLRRSGLPHDDDAVQFAREKLFPKPAKSHKTVLKREA